MRPEEQPSIRFRGTFADKFPCFFGSDGFGGEGWEFYGGYIDDSDARSRVDTCLTPARPPNGQRAVFILGDSHARAIAPAVQAAFDGLAQVSYVSFSFMCGYVSEEYIHGDASNIDGGERMRHACSILNAQVDETLNSQLRGCDIVVLHQHSYRLNDGKLQGPERKVASVVARYRHLQAMVRAKGAQLVLLGDTLQLPEEGWRCAANAAMARSCELTTGQAHAQLERERSVYTDLARDDPGTHYFALDELMCDAGSGTCGAFVPGTSTLAYSDKDHLTIAGALYLWPFICAFLTDNGLL